MGFVKSIVGRNNRQRVVIDQQFIIFIGNDRDTDFWNDDLIGCGQVWYVFLRIFALARDKSGTVSSFGGWE